jgi:MarR family transcriptional regulator, organic hydroperoxide resistance regulator
LFGAAQTPMIRELDPLLSGFKSYKLFGLYQVMAGFYSGSMSIGLNEIGRDQAIEEIAGFQERLQRVFLNSEFEHWCKLDVPIAQLKSLFIIVHRDGTNSRTLAQYLGVTQGNVTGIVDRLVQQGLVVRNPNSNDRRIIPLEATAAGRQLLTDLIEGQTKHLARILSAMSLEEVGYLHKGLAAFVRSAEEYQKELNIEHAAQSR